MLSPIFLQDIFYFGERNVIQTVKFFCTNYNRYENYRYFFYGQTIDNIHRTNYLLLDLVLAKILWSLFWTLEYHYSLPIFLKLKLLFLGLQNLLEMLKFVIIKNYIYLASMSSIERQIVIFNL